MAVRSGDDALYFAEQGGKVVADRGGAVDPTPVLDLSGKITSGGEQGLLGLAFSPDGAHLYVDYTDTNGDTNVVEYAMNAGRADPSSARRVLFVHQPFANHNGGEVVFGPDGDLYVGLGDGGSEGDPMGNSQSLLTLLGKILRIDPHPSDGRAYTIPGDNPFVSRRSALPEIWDYGLRNPWRFSFDRETGDLWIGDVGGSQREEVDFLAAGQQAGANLGWVVLEGSLPSAGHSLPGSVLPIYEYAHSGGACVVTGGYVYRGQAIPNLRGAYLFADFCTGQISALVERDGKVVARRTLGLKVPDLSSFGESQDGELYAISLSGPVYRIDPA